MRLPSCLTPTVNSGVLKTARCFGKLLEGHTELSKAVVLMVMVYYRERICVNRKEPRKVVHRVGQESYRRGLLGSTQHHVWCPWQLHATRALAVPALGVHSFYWDSSHRCSWLALWLVSDSWPSRGQADPNPPPWITLLSCLPWPKVPRQVEAQLPRFIIQGLRD